jgi:hypothetical protein
MSNLMIPIPIPKLTDNLNEPGFFAPLAYLYSYQSC